MSASRSWVAHGACLDCAPELFFPIGKNVHAVEQAQRAKEICLSCIVREQCLRWALETNQSAGVWGGLDEHERLTLRHRTRRQARNAQQINQVTLIQE
ncbi:MAG: WhiB family transcriptional regulator [Egibacteraceae bacterium]